MKIKGFLSGIVGVGVLVGCSAESIAGATKAVKDVSAPVVTKGAAAAPVKCCVDAKVFRTATPLNSDGSRHWKDLDIYIGFSEPVKNVEMVVRNPDGSTHTRYKYPEYLYQPEQTTFALSVHGMEYATHYAGEVTAVSINDGEAYRQKFTFDTQPAPVPNLVIPDKVDTPSVYYFEHRTHEKIAKVTLQFWYHDGVPTDYNSDVRQVIDLFTASGFVSVGEASGSPDTERYLEKISPDGTAYNTVVQSRDDGKDFLTTIHLFSEERSLLSERLSALREHIKEDIL